MMPRLVNNEPRSESETKGRLRGDSQA